MIDFYREHKVEFKEAQGFIEKGGKSYPVMRLADLYFHNVGSVAG